MLLTTEVEWHDLRVDPDDLPSEGEPILVTVETFTGRATWMDVEYSEESLGKPIFYTRVINPETNIVEKQAVWYPVIAWAYAPDPYNYF